MKKFLSGLLSLMMIISLCVPTFAVSPTAELAESVLLYVDISAVSEVSLTNAIDGVFLWVMKDGADEYSLHNRPMNHADGNVYYYDISSEVSSIDEVNHINISIFYTDGTSSGELTSGRVTHESGTNCYAPSGEDTGIWSVYGSSGSVTPSEADEAKWGESKDKLNEGSSGTLAEAIAAAKTDSSIKYIQLQKNPTVPEEGGYNIKGGTFTLDLNGFSITHDTGTPVYVSRENTEVTFTDGSTEKTGKIVGGNSAIEVIQGKAVFTGGSYEGQCALLIEKDTDKTVSAEIKDGSFTGSYHSAVNNKNTLTVSGGTFTATGDAPYAVYNQGTMTISGGSFGAGRFGAISLDSGTTTITGGTFTAGSDAHFSYWGGKLDLSGYSTTSTTDTALTDLTVYNDVDSVSLTDEVLELPTGYALSADGTTAATELATGTKYSIISTSGSSTDPTPSTPTVTGVTVTVDGTVYDSTNTSATNPAKITPDTQSVIFTVLGTNLDQLDENAILAVTPMLGFFIKDFTVSSDKTNASDTLTSTLIGTYLSSVTDVCEVTYIPDPDNGASSVGLGVYYIYDDGNADVDTPEISDISLIVDGTTYDSTNTSAAAPAQISESSSVELKITGRYLNKMTDDYFLKLPGIRLSMNNGQYNSDKTELTVTYLTSWFNNCTSATELVYTPDNSPSGSGNWIQTGIYVIYKLTVPVTAGDMVYTQDGKVTKATATGDFAIPATDGYVTVNTGYTAQKLYKVDSAAVSEVTANADGVLGSNEVSVRSDAIATGLRFKSSFLTALRNSIKEYGYLVTVESAYNALPENYTLDLALAESGKAKKGIAYKVDGEGNIVTDISYDSTETRTIVTAVATGIPLTAENVKTYIAARPYYVLDANTVVYGEITRSTVAEVANAVKSAGGVAYTANKEYIDKIVDLSITWKTVDTSDDLQEALENGGYIKLGKNIMLTDTLIQGAGTTVVLDLNGKKLTASEGLPESRSMLELENSTIRDNVGGGSIEREQNGSVIQVISGNFCMESGTVTGNYVAVQIYSDVNMTVSGGKIHSKDVASVSLSTNTNLTVTGGEISGRTGISCANATVAVSGGSVSGSLYVFSDSGMGCNVTVKGGNLSGSLILPTDSLTVIGGTFDNDPTGYVDTENYTVTNTDGKYTVTEKD